ncbi:uncharacterized protein LTHEOB_11858 [Lasiodiplodia theobromae]|uniref:uncharacterized protein n=1 Tax=Lasiodiplodia theobromae TaxID=45133 RepID=UPI0015C34A6B|nr:uncharacterized protein LTHEOB_11858 [Lasiodiplodia theobromae]KAF4536851.1 hypothetical protein LTHEOB_11858 [Lasiodiplodia theobromae]
MCLSSELLKLTLKDNVFESLSLAVSDFESIERMYLSAIFGREKFQWEWRRVKYSLSAKRRDKVLEDLRHWNEDLRRLLENSEVPAEDDSRKVQDLKRRFDVQRCNSIHKCFSSLHRALESGFRCVCSPPHQAAIDLDWTTHESDTAKPFKVAISYGTNSQLPKGPDSWRKLRITTETPETPTKMVLSVPELLTPSPTPARAPSSTSSIRTKVSQFKSVFSSPRPRPSPPIPPTTASLLKDPDEDQNWQFFLDHKEKDSPEIIKAVPLKSLLLSLEQATQQRNSYLSLSAKQRYGIATSIAWSVLHLSGSPWFGDHWEQTQVSIFVKKTQDGREVLSRYPCASCIFSPPASMGEPPSNDFKHLIPNRTVFAPGIFLIELCTNKSFAEIREAGGSMTPASLLDDYQTAVSNLDEVYRLAGDSYGYATERCVKFSFQGRDLYKNFDFSQFRQQFHDAVVAPVQATYLMLPDSRNPG